MGVRGEIMMIVSLLVMMSSTAINIPAICVNLRICTQTQQYLPLMKTYPQVVDHQKEEILAILAIASSIAHKISFQYMAQANHNMPNPCLSSLSSKLTRVQASLDKIRSQFSQQGGMPSLTQKIIFLYYSPREIVDNIVLHGQDPCNKWYKRGLKKLSRSPNKFIRGAAKGGLTAVKTSELVKDAKEFFTTFAKSIRL